MNLLQMTSYGSWVDTMEANKENIPFPHHFVPYDKLPSVVLPVSNKNEEVIDVVLNSPTLSQISNASSAGQ